MKNLLVLSDTHLRRADDIPPQLVHEAARADLVLHAGDFTCIEIVERLEELATMFAVWGNMDDHRVIARLPDACIVEVEGIKIGLTHGSGAPSEAIRNARSRFDQVDLIVFGHTHHPFNDKWHGIRMFNPGSPTDRRFAPFRCFGWIEVDGNAFEVRHVDIQD